VFPKPVKFVVRIHAGEPNQEALNPLILKALIAILAVVDSNSTAITIGDSLAL
jgi:hypothetical protein